MLFPSSPDLAPTAIDLDLHGRWRVALASLKKRDVIQVECAYVRASRDPDINTLRLELPDPFPDDVHKHRTAVYLLNPHLRPKSVVTYDCLGVGLKALSSDQLMRFRNNHVHSPGSDQEPDPTALRDAIEASIGASPRVGVDRLQVHQNGNGAPTPAHLRTRVAAVASSKDHEYIPVANIADTSISYGKKKIDIYGVVIECRAPSVTRTPHHRSEIVVADESSVEQAYENGNLKALPVFTFEKDPKHAIPYRAVGDIIRIHRVTINEYTDPRGITTRQGCARFFSTFVLWDHDADDFLPSTARNPIRTAASHVAPDVQHKITDYDRQRITQLRKWTREYLFTTHKFSRPFMRTVLEVKTAHPTADFLTKTFDLICRVEGEATPRDPNGNLRLVVSDGLLDKGQGGQRMLVESTDPHRPDGGLMPYKFSDYCPSWHLRPAVMPAWVLMRDIRMVTRNNDRVVILSVGRRSSTLVWNAENAPDVRQLKEAFALHAQGLPPPRAAPVRNAPGYGGGGAGHASDIAERARSRDPAPLSRGNASGTVAGSNTRNGPVRSPPRRSIRKRPHPEGNVRGSAAADEGPRKEQRLGNVMSGRQQTPGQAREDTASTQQTHQDSLNRDQTRQAVGNDSENADDTRTGSDRGHFDESQAQPLVTNRPKIVITKHKHEDKVISTIAQLMDCVDRGKKGYHRLKVTARAMSIPSDVRYACKPWCYKCNRYMKIDISKGGQLDCTKCTYTTTNNRDPRTRWVFSVQLLLEDDEGGRMFGWIEGLEGTEFFNGPQPDNLIYKSTPRLTTSKFLQVVLDSKHVLDCIVKPFQWEDKYGCYHTCCKIFGTQLMTEYHPQLPSST